MCLKACPLDWLIQDWGQKTQGFAHAGHVLYQLSYTLNPTILFFNETKSVRTLVNAGFVQG